VLRQQLRQRKRASVRNLLCSVVVNLRLVASQLMHVIWCLASLSVRWLRTARVALAPVMTSQANDVGQQASNVSGIESQLH
jgi:hypothetical protein